MPTKAKVVLKDRTKGKSSLPGPEKPLSVRGSSRIKVLGKIPSKWLPYPKGMEIYYHPYTHGDLIAFNQTDSNGRPVMDAAQQMDFVMSGIETGGVPFDKWELSYRDFLFVSLLRRLSTFDTNQFIMAYKCRTCGVENQAIFDLGRVDILDVEVPALPIVYTTTSGTELHFSLLTVGSYLKLFKAGSLKDEILVLAEMVSNIPDKEMAQKILYEARGEGAQDISALVEINSMLLTGVAPMDHTCQSCSRFNEGEVEKSKEKPGYEPLYRDPVNRLGFYDPEVVVYPFREADDSFRDRIRFGLPGTR